MKKHLWEMINTVVEAVELLLEYAEAENIEMQERVCTGLQDILGVIVAEVEHIKAEVPEVNLSAMSVSTRVSFIRSREYLHTDRNRAIQKIRFELLPLAEEMRMNYYYWVLVYPNQEAVKKYYEEEIHTFFRNPYLEEAERNGSYKYDVSIMVLAYNKLQYTVACIESLKRYLPKTFSYELILVNHGSSDGTKEYFESLKPDKQIDIAVNGGGANAVYRCVEGRYTIGISNDVLVTENALDNLYRCITHDEMVGWVVPTTPNISNYQAIPLKYSNLEGMYAAAAANNVLNYSRHEQRVRLCNPIDIYSNWIAYEIKWFGSFSLNGEFSFSDDRKSLLYRRAGYKMLLAKDAYCYHFGSVTLRDDNINGSYYWQGRQKFRQIYGVEPWGKGFCYDKDFFEKLTFKQKEVGYILGVNCGMGSNALKVKECLKETGRYSKKIELTNCTNEKQYINDIAGISDYAYEFEEWSDLKEIEAGKRYSYIVWECDGEIELKDFEEVLQVLKERLTEEGEIFLRCMERSQVEKSKEIFSVLDVIHTQIGNLWIRCNKNCMLNIKESLKSGGL